MANALTKIKADALTADLIDETKLADNSIDSEHYNDGSIDNAHIADDAIDSEHYAAGSIDTAHIADDQITLAKMASGTDGNIISYDASGNPVAIATGNDGQVLTSTGAGSPPAFEAIPASGTPNNLLHNGAMQVYQRGTSLALAHDGSTAGYIADRWRLEMHNMDEFDGTLAIVGDDPTGEFTKCLRWTTGTAESAIAANEDCFIRQMIESQSLQHLRWGTGSAKQLTLQFWVKSSVTGTYGCTFYSARSSGYRVINTTYAISSANTWEQKTITIAADTGGSVLANDNEAGLSIMFALAAGSNWDSTNSTSWADYSTGNYLGGHAQDGVVTTGGATWQITGVQLETGSTAGSFEHKSYGEELARSQRYYQRFTYGTQAWVYCEGNGAQYKWIYADFSPMRASPTVGLGNLPTGSATAAGGSGTISSYTNAGQAGIVGSGGRVSLRATWSADWGTDYSLHHTDGLDDKYVSFESDL
tara:strand:- start:154 stop:1578 length:1425 start_codon:yes stop_codon:yes gene_type:complete